jgi:predicted transcriptional regulator
VQNRDADWFDELSSKQQADVLEGIAQLDSGKTVSHEDAKKRFGIL